MTLPYHEGTWFAVPLRSGGFGLGRVTRMAPEGKVLVGYFFGPRRRTAPTLSNTFGLTPQDASLVVRFGDLSLVQGDWRILGDAGPWDRSQWPTPDFLREDPLSGQAWRVRYDDDYPNIVVDETLVSPKTALGRDGLFGAGAVEIALDRKLT